MKMKLQPINKWTSGYLQQLDTRFITYIMAVKPALYKDLLAFENREKLTDEEREKADKLAQAMADGYEVYLENPEKCDQEAEEILDVKSIYPVISSLNNSKVFSSVPTISKETRPRKVGVSDNNAVTVSVIIKTTENLPANINNYDLRVHDAICSLYKAGNVYFTPEQVYRVMNGKSANTRIRKTSLTKIIDSIEKQRKTLYMADYSKQNEAWSKDKQVKKVKVDGFLLSLKHATAVIDGKKIDCYKMLDSSVLYDYAANIGHLLYIPTAALDTSDVLKGSDETQEIFVYLIREINAMNNPKIKRNPKIKYETLFKECGVEVPGVWPAPEPGEKYNDVKFRRMRDYVKKLLTKLQNTPLNMNNEDGPKYLKGFKEYKEKGSKKVLGVQIILDKKESESK